MDLTPSSIRRKTFQLVRRGFDPQEVGAYLEQLAEHVSSQQQIVSTAQANTAKMESELKDARSAEEAVRLTMVAATQAKEEILASANADATGMRQAAKTETEQLRERARREAEQTISEARQEAMAMLESSRRDAESRVAAAQQEHTVLVAQVEQLREMVTRTRNTLVRLVDGAVGQLDDAAAFLAPAPTSGTAQGPVVGREPSEQRDPGSIVIPELPSRSGDDGSRPPLEIVSDHTAAHDATSLDIVAEIEPMLEEGGTPDEAGSVVQLPDAVDRLLNQLRDING